MGLEGTLAANGALQTAAQVPLQRPRVGTQHRRQPPAQGRPVPARDLGRLAPPTLPPKRFGDLSGVDLQNTSECPGSGVQLVLADLPEDARRVGRLHDDGHV